MSDRRDFLKTAGLLSLVPLSKAVPSVAQREPSSPNSDNQTKAAKGLSPEGKNIVLENAEMRLEISPAGVARSLIHKASGQECLMQDMDIPMFSVTQYRPYDNELQLAYPAEVTEFAAIEVKKLGNELLVEIGRRRVGKECQ